MRQGIAYVLLCSVLTGCAAPNNGSWWDGWGYLASAEIEHQFDFSWALTGSDQLAPLQVFSNAKQVWLQFPRDGDVPALFSLSRDGVVRPVQAQQQGIYHVVNESVDVLLLRKGIEEAWAYRTVVKPMLLRYLQKQQMLAQQSRARQAVAQSIPVPSSDTARRNATRTEPVQVQEQVSAPSKSERRSGKRYVKNEISSETTSSQTHQIPIARAIPSEGQLSSLSRPINTALTEDTGALGAEQQVADVPTSVSARQHSVFASLSSDKSLKQLIQRWAHDAAWVFNDEHWAVSAEIPLSGPFTQQGNFTDAVQQLLLSTQLSDYPLRPCFYSNKVLRVIPFEQSCLALGVSRGES